MGYTEHALYQRRFCLGNVDKAAAGRLPMHHRDPFDRMLIAQAQAEGLQILTKDEHFPAYGVRLINALK